MNRNVVIVFAGGLLIAVLVAMLVQLSLGKKEEPVKTVKVEERVEILVAAKDIPMGADLSAENMTWRAWPEGAVFPGAIKREGNAGTGDAIKGRAKRAIAKGEPVVKAALLEKEKGNLVAANLEPGQRAVSIGVSASSMVAGFIGPGDYVDVLLTYKQSVKAEDSPQVQAMIDRNLDKLATETILQNVRVLAVDQRAKRAEDDKIKVGKTVTLAVDAQDAEKLTLAQEMGALTLSLRGVGDDVALQKDWSTITDARLTKIDDELFDERAKMQGAGGAIPKQIKIYAGDSVTSATVK